MSEIIISPIFYMGNKRRLINKGLCNMFPDNIETFVDVFSGSGVVGMNTKAEYHIVNDKDENLYKLYGMFYSYDPDEIISHIEDNIEKFGLARERTRRCEYKDKQKLEAYKQAYMKLRDRYNNCRSIFDLYTLMIYSFSQGFRFNKKDEFNMPVGTDCFCDKHKEYIINGCKFFHNHNFIHHKDFRTVMKEDFLKPLGLNNPFYYCDCPYLGTDAIYNERGLGWSEQDEQDLHDILDEVHHRGQKFALSGALSNKGKKNEMLAEWIEKNGYRVHHFADFAYTACGKGNAKTDEILVMNY